MPSTIRNSLLWILDAFEHEPTYMRRRMFGCDAAYLDGLLCLIAADRAKPFNGVLVCTDCEQHAALAEQIPALRPHPVISKWLYVPQDDPTFESAVETLTALVLARDPRIGASAWSRNRASAPCRKTDCPFFIDVYVTCTII
ncbi:hypothetical protein BHUM_00030c [Candidatus Burkholderia humilis]|nr:hypothetical protein BHUM_00030c [Candidatus Burkholderia humilis]